MCMITHKPKGVELDLTYLENALPYNQDGFGLSFFDKKVRVFTTMDFDELLTMINECMDYELLIHQRAASIGKVELKNAQPFLVGGNAFLHNGTIRSFSKAKNNLSDSFYLAKVLNSLDKSMWRTFIDRFTCNSRIAVMDKKGKVSLYGKWIMQGQIAFSSDYYMWSNDYLQEDSFYYEEYLKGVEYGKNSSLWNS